MESREDVENVIIIPDHYIPGWIFEQKEISKIEGNSSKFVVLNYYPTLWKPSNITMSIVSDKGKYYTEQKIEMKKDEGLTGFIFYIIDNLRMSLSK